MAELSDIAGAVLNQPTTTEDTTSTTQPETTGQATAEQPTDQGATDLATENQWMAGLNKWANDNFADPVERQHVIDESIRKRRNRLSSEIALNKMQLASDKTGLNTILYNTEKFGIGPRNETEAMQIDPNFSKMLADAKSRNNDIQKYVDSVFAHNSKQDPPFTDDRHRKFDAAVGIIRDAMDGIKDKDEVINKLNPAVLDLPKAQTQELNRRLQGLRRSRSVEDKLDVYMHWANDIFSKELGATPDEDTRLQVKGAMEVELKRALIAKGGDSPVLNRSDVEQVASNVVRDRADRSGFFGSFASPQRLYMVPKDFENSPEAHEWSMLHKGATPTPDALYDLYRKKQTQ